MENFQTIVPNTKKKLTNFRKSNLSYPQLIYEYVTNCHMM